MHHVIRFIVKAANKEEAMDAAASALDGIAGEGRYGTFFHEDGHGVSGKDRWGDIPAAMPLLSEMGMSLVLEGLEADYEDMRGRFEEAKRAVRKGFDYIYKDGMARYYLKSMGRLEFVYLGGYGFVDAAELGSCLGEDGLDEMWVVPCDVHT